MPHRHLSLPKARHRRVAHPCCIKHLLSSTLSARQAPLGDDALKETFPRTPCVLLGRDITRAQYDVLMADAREAQQLDLAELGAQLSEGGLTELGALCPDVQAVFCPREASTAHPQDH